MITAYGEWKERKTIDRKRKECKKRSIKQEGNMIAQREYTRRGINMRNEMRMEFDAVSNNEGFARVAVAAFIAPLNPTLEEVSDIKTGSQ